MKFKLFFALMFFLPQLSEASARLILNYEQRTATIKADLNFFGTIKEDVLKKVTEIISKQWAGFPTLPGDSQEVHPDFWINGYHLRIKTDIQVNFVQSIEEAKRLARSNQSLIQNFIRVEEGGPNAISVTGNGGANAYKFFYKNDLDHTTTAAHEFGHGLGMGHISHFTAGLPSMMIERGSKMVEPQYFWVQNDPNSTINPNLRRVTQSDLYEFMNAIDNLPTQTDSDGTVYIDIGNNMAARDNAIFKSQVLE